MKYIDLTQEQKNNVYEFLNNKEEFIVVGNTGYFENEGCFLGNTEQEAFDNMETDWQKEAVEEVD